MRQNKTHVFVARSPFHLFIVKNIVGSCLDENDLVIVFYEGRQIEWQGKPVQVEFVQLGQYVTSKGAWATATDNLKTINRRLNMLEAPVSVYMTDTRWPTNNQLYFRLRGNSKYELSVFAEGLASYIDRGDRVGLAIKSLAKYLLSKIRLAAPYRPFISDNLGYLMPGFHCFYAPQADRVRVRARKVELPMRSSSLGAERRDNALLFLGQPIEQKLPNEIDQLPILLSTIEKVKALGHAQLFYKPHQFEGRFAQTVFSENGFVILDQGGVFEEWVGDQWRGKAIASYFSTALATAGMLLPPEDVQLYSVEFERVAGLYLNAKDKQLLRNSLALFKCKFI
ncbi:hypothetical protein KW869_13570 [Pseudomonas urmiensis]|jgi:hypothetical protein|uniref:Uncharacterized protein n=1 Tax=Pseudomonas urmiensis TaxID=2745493 RepID=A0ABW8NX57_9PSED